MPNSYHPFHQYSGMKPMKGWVYIYALCHPATRCPYYVGQSKDPAERYTAHMNDRANSPKTKWIARLKRNQKRPRLDILAVVPEPDALAMESFFISFLGVHGRLTNRVSGPEPRYGEVMSFVGLRLPAHLIEKAKRIGGNVSAGLRKAIEEHQAD